MQNDQIDVEAIHGFAIRLFDVVLSSWNSDLTSNFEMANHSFEVKWSNERLNDFFKPALGHVLSDDKNKEAFTIMAIEAKSSGVTLPPPTWQWNEFNQNGIIYSDDDLILAFESWSGILRLMDRKMKTAILWIEDVSSLPAWMRSFPFRTLIDWYFEHSKIQPVHSGGIALGKNGVLITGKGGAGKSSTCISCLENDKLKYLGDDFLLLDIENHMAHTMYNVAKVAFENLKKFPELHARKEEFASDDEKYQMFVHDLFPDKTVSKFKIKAIVIPRVTGEEEACLVPTKGSDALIALAPSTIYLLKGNKEKTFRKLTTFVNALPVYYLNLSKYYHKNPELIYRFLSNEPLREAI